MNKDVSFSLTGSGVITLAEGIETLEEFNAIKELGVELAQGYLLGKTSKILKWEIYF
ncbi:MAG: hypothetical protein ABWK15_02450 [Dissulfuribacterales bacterium]